MRISSSRSALTTFARVRRLAEADRAGIEFVEAVDASDRESGCRQGSEGVEGVGEGGERAEEGPPGERHREVAGRGRGAGATKVGATREAVVLVNWSDAKKNCTLSFVWATRRAS